MQNMNGRRIAGGTVKCRVGPPALVCVLTLGASCGVCHRHEMSGASL